MVNIQGVIGNGEGEVNLISVIEQVQKENEQIIIVNIDSIGGDLDVGFSIYNYLLKLPHKVITTCINNCASAASIVFLAGDERIAGCPIMIHNPYFDGISGDKATLMAAADCIGEYEKNLEKAYSERTKLDSETLSMLMDSETYLSPNQAVSLGFATQSKPTALARINNLNINKNVIQMSKKTIGETLREALGMKPKANENTTKSEKPKAYAMELTTADGGTLTVDREEGEPQVGDKANPNGSHTMPDGSIIVVENDAIINIIPPENEDTTVEETAIEEVADTLETVIVELQSEVETLKEELANAKKLAKKPEELKILNAVKIAGGVDKVLKNFKSSYSPKPRTEVQSKSTETSKLQQRINALKNKEGK